MKNPSIISALIGGTFFAVPYLGLSIGLLPSLAIGVGAFGAGELILHAKKEENVNIGKTAEQILSEAKHQNEQIKNMAPLIEDKEIVDNIIVIHETVDKIIKTVESKPMKMSKIENFFDYYLPETVKFLRKYDEIENQRLGSVDSKKFMESGKEMTKKIKDAFKVQLDSLYQSDIIDTGAEMKVFETMLKTDGFDTLNDFNKNDDV